MGGVNVAAARRRPEVWAAQTGLLAGGSRSPDISAQGGVGQGEGEARQEQGEAKENQGDHGIESGFKIGP